MALISSFIKISAMFMDVREAKQVSFRDFGVRLESKTIIPKPMHLH